MFVTVEAVLEEGVHGRGRFLYFHLPEDAADFLFDLPITRGGFGSIKVDATIGRTSWRTSVFPTNGTYLLLLARKRANAERLTPGDTTKINLAVVVP